MRSECQIALLATTPSELLRGNELEMSVAENDVNDGNNVKERIVRAAADLFMQRGFAGTTVREIGERAGVGQSSLYHHAHSKGQLLAELHSKHVQEIIGLLESILDANETPTTQLRKVVSALLTMVDSHRAVVTVYLRESYALSDEAREEVRNERKKTDAIIDQIIKRGKECGEFRSDLDVFLTRRAILGMCNWAYQWYQPNGPRSIEEISETFADLAVAAVVNGPHVKLEKSKGRKVKTDTPGGW